MSRLVGKDVTILRAGSCYIDTFIKRNISSYYQFKYVDCLMMADELSFSVFSCLVRSYTTFIQEGKPPCIQEATKEMIEYENQNVLHHAVDIYKGKMHGLIGSNMPGSKTIVNLHEKSTQKAIDYLRENIVYDDVQLILDTAKVRNVFSNFIPDLIY